MPVLFSVGLSQRWTVGETGLQWIPQSSHFETEVLASYDDCPHYLIAGDSLNRFAAEQLGVYMKLGFCAQEAAVMGGRRLLEASYRVKTRQVGE